MTVSVVQTKDAAGAGTGTTLNFTSSVSTGNSVVVWLADYNTSGSTISSSAPTYNGGSVSGATQLVNVQSTGAHVAYFSVWLLPNVQSSGTSVNVGTITNAAQDANARYFIAEVSGLGASPAADTASPNPATAFNNSSTAVSSGATGNAAGSSGIVLGGMMNLDDTTWSGPAAGWTNFGAAAFGGASYQVFSASGNNYTWSTTLGAANEWASGAVIVDVTAAASVTYVRPRAVPVPPQSPVPWAQRDRRDANTVATAANPLVSPLDTAWQADGRYSHLYGDSHLRDRRQYFYQRNYISPPGLLATAELENELLGGAGTAQRYGFPAYYDRREVPQQPARLADPLLIQTAELENELLGGADTARHCLTAAWYDRREVPQQRLYISDPSAYPPQNNLDPLLAGQDYLDGHQHQAATHCDRREVPQQRLYISDPSFYSSSAPTDPLTVAWGAGGSYWHLYNRASDITDRREVPQQRLYVSDPLLLTTAQLENELLGGAETGKYYRTPATHAARWWMPQQPPRLADPLLIQTAELENELLGGGDTIRYYLAAAYWDRREVPEQRAYVSDPSFYPSGAVTDPLTVAWGAGGPYWHLYNRAADVTDRREVPQQRSYVADPLLLATALLENELLGGAGTAMRYLLPATHYDRRQAGQQRAYPAAPDIPFNPVLAAWAEGLRRALLAATHADRRLYPQQRLYFPPPAPPPPFTVGLLTAVTAPGSALTAADVALAILTAVTAASGGTDTTAP